MRAWCCTARTDVRGAAQQGLTCVVLRSKDMHAWCCTARTDVRGAAQQGLTCFTDMVQKLTTLLRTGVRSAVLQEVDMVLPDV